MTLDRSTGLPCKRRHERWGRKERPTSQTQSLRRPGHPGAVSGALGLASDGSDSRLEDQLYRPQEGRGSVLRVGPQIYVHTYSRVRARRKGFRIRHISGKGR